MELKVKAVDRDEDDYTSILAQLRRSIGRVGDEESATVNVDDVILHLSEAQAALQSLAGDDYLSNMVTTDDSHGYILFKSANSAVGVALDELASFATSELRVRHLNSYVSETFPC